MKLCSSALIGVACVSACSPEYNFLGYDDPAVTLGPELSVPPPERKPDAGDVSSLEAGTPADPPVASTTPTPDGGAPNEPTAPISDSGVPDGGATEPGAAPPNPFVDVLGLAPEAVDARIAATFEQLFHGNRDTQAIYREVSEDQAYIHDVLHDDTRIDALGYGLLVTVLLDKKSEFDKIWNFTKANLQYATGPNQGYFHSTCPTSGTDCADDVGVFGTFFVVTSLLMAENRWSNGTGVYDYGTEARSILDTLRFQEQRNGGVVDGVTNVFQADPALPARNPTLLESDQVSPGSVMPAFFQFWGIETGVQYWLDAAERGRELLRAAIHPATGLTPNAVYFDGSVVPGEEGFREASYAVGFHWALDTSWYGRDPAQVEFANRLISFFARFGGSYPALYLYTGELQNQNPSGALVALNGAAAGIATLPERVAFMRVVWETPTQEGVFRYYDGINQLLSLMYLGGYLRP